MDKLDMTKIFEAISVDDADLIPLAHGKIDPDYNDSIEPALDFLRDHIQVPQLDVGRGMPVNLPPNETGELSEVEIYGTALLLLEGKGWKIDGEKREKLLGILGKSVKDVISVYLMD